MVQTFISYARKDYLFVDRLRDDLRRAGINYWIDREGLTPGTPSWERAIREALKACESVLWIVSPDSFESTFVRDEISIARLYKRKIYPVFAKGDHWLECVPLGAGEIQYIDARADYAQALAEIVKALAAPASPYVMPEESTPELPGHAEPRNPYKALNAFTEADAGDFFGREALVERLHTRITDSLKRKGNRLLAVLGPSGAGKSSVVMAGLIPALKKAHAHWVILPKMAPGKHPLESLADALYGALPDKSLSTVENDLKMPGGRMLHRLAQQVHGEQVVLYIDQFEELFTQTENEGERQQFISLIVQAAAEPDGKVIVLLSMRADFYGHPLNYPQLGALVEANNVGVLPMSITELRDAIEKPARLPDVGLTFEDGLVAEIIFALRDRKGVLAGALPLLQFTLTRLFAQREGARLTFAAYHAMGGVDGAVGTHCEEVFCGLPEAVQNKLGAVFLPLVSFDEQTGEPTRRRAPLASVAADADARALVDVLVKERLLQTGSDGDSGYLEVAHEALFRSWERLKNWIAEAQEDLILLRQVRTAAHDWQTKREREPEKDFDYLRWPAERLKLVYAMQERLHPELNEVERDFIEPEQHRLLRELETLPRDETSHGRRRDIGDRLAVIGDTRPGVGCILLPSPSGEGQGMRAVPDIVWLPVQGSNEPVFVKTDEREIGPVTISDFYVAKYLITYEQFQVFVDAEDGFNDLRWWAEMPEEYQRQRLVSQRTKIKNAPRDSLSWYQALAFARWLDAKYRELGLFEQFLPSPPAPLPNAPAALGEGLQNLPLKGEYRAQASAVLVQIARELRQRETPAEELLWECLRDRRLAGLKFRRQHPVANTTYVVDFFCYEHKLVIELDGGIHATQREADAQRQRELEAQGLRILRIPNDLLYAQLEDVLALIAQTALESSPLPASVSERSGEGQGVRADWQIRLPTEWEWQWMAQGGAEMMTYPWGNDWREGCANTSEVGLSRTTAVGMYPHGAADCGALDVAGNLWEWCLNDRNNPEIINGYSNREGKALRGGSFVNYQNFAAASCRSNYLPRLDHSPYGVRLVVAAPISAL